MFLIYSHYQKVADVALIADRLKEKIEFTDDTSNPDIRGIFVLGGDGTLLRVISEFHGKIPLIYSFNYGSYGFLTPFLAEQVDEVAQKIVDNFEFEVIERGRLEIMGLGHALNDILITKRNHGKLNTFRMLLNGHEMGEVRCDSVLVSTDSGSSAYNYSSGGPLLSSGCRAFVVNCLNPCQIFFRPIVLGASCELEVFALDSVHDTSESICVIDGYKEIIGVSHFRITISSDVIRFASFITQEKTFANDVGRLQHLT